MPRKGGPIEIMKGYAHEGSNRVGNLLSGGCRHLAFLFRNRPAHMAPHAALRPPPAAASPVYLFLGVPHVSGKILLNYGSALDDLHGNIA